MWGQLVVLLWLSCPWASASLHRIVGVVTLRVGHAVVVFSIRLGSAGRALAFFSAKWADDGSDYRARTALMSDGMVNLARQGFAAAADSIRAAGVHILMEMQLHTRGVGTMGPWAVPLCMPLCGPQGLVSYGVGSVAVVVRI